MQTYIARKSIIPGTQICLFAIIKVQLKKILALYIHAPYVKLAFNFIPLNFVFLFPVTTCSIEHFNYLYQLKAEYMTFLKMLSFKGLMLKIAHK